MHSRSGSSDEAAANLVMTQLSDLLASDVPKDTAAGKNAKQRIYFLGDVVRLFPFPKKNLPCVVPLKSLSASRDAAGFEAHLVSLHTSH